MPIASPLQRSLSLQHAVCPVCSLSDCSHAKHATKQDSTSALVSKAIHVGADADGSARKKRRIQRTLTARQHHDDWVDISTQRLSTTTLGALYPGSCFKGTQECGSNEYEVVVDIKHIDLKESTLSGYLNIKGLTSEFPELTTYFEGEIIGPKYSFVTRKWQAFQRIDLEHWKRFPSFNPYIHLFHQEDFKYDPAEQDFIYMRWKERFLVPDHRVKNIHGASYEGFYYICYQRSTNEILGYYYFYNHNDWYQELKLRHIKQRCFGHFEFR